MSYSIDQQKSALQILVNGVETACKRGAYSIAEAASLHQAITIFQPKPDQPVSESQQSQQQPLQQQPLQQQPLQQQPLQQQPLQQQPLQQQSLQQSQQES